MFCTSAIFIGFLDIWHLAYFLTLNIWPCEMEGYAHNGAYTLQKNIEKQRHECSIVSVARGEFDSAWKRTATPLHLSLPFSLFNDSVHTLCITSFSSHTTFFRFSCAGCTYFFSAVPPFFHFLCHSTVLCPFFLFMRCAWLFSLSFHYPHVAHSLTPFSCPCALQSYFLTLAIKEYRILPSLLRDCLGKLARGSQAFIATSLFGNVSWV